jgi:hypothetical protein
MPQYGSSHNRLAAVEGTIKQLLETLGCEEVNSLSSDPVRGKSTNSYQLNERRRKKLLRICIHELQKLQYDNDEDDDERAFSTDTSTWTDSQKDAYRAMCKGLRLKE